MEPDTAIKALEPYISQKRKDTIRRVISNRTDSIALVLDNLYDPHNGSAILRTCDAFGIGHLHILESRNRFRTSQRVTQGAHFWLDILKHRTVDSCVEALESAGHRLIAFDHRGTASLNDIEKMLETKRLALCFGNEHEGITPGLLEAADSIVRIPMLGFVKCLNVSVSAAVVLSRMMQKARPNLSQKQKLILCAKFYSQCVRGSQDILKRHFLQNVNP